MELNNNEKPNRKYWVSLEQYNNDPVFLESSKKEFASSPLLKKSEGGGNSPEGTDQDGLNRRDFLKLMAASSAMATAACYQKPMHKILPYVNQPEEITFGIANDYASVCGECSTGCGTLVKTREGRPIKIEGNPDHPINKGGLCARGQAGLLNLYDPDRLRKPLKGKTADTWENLDKEIVAILKSSKSVRILTETENGPSTKKLIGEFLSLFPKSSHTTYDAIGADAVLEAQALTYGERILPRYRFDRADLIVSVDADFLGTWISPVEFTKQFSAKRKLSDSQKKLSKLYVFESVMTITGSNADERFAIKPSNTFRVLAALAGELIKLGVHGDAGIAELGKKYSPETTGYAKSIRSLAHELVKAQGRSLVVTGSAHGQGELAVASAVMANIINSMLKNDGQTVDYNISPSNQLQGNIKQVAQLVQEMKAGQVDTLIIHRANPTYTLPESFGFTDALKKVKNVIYIGLDLNETAQNANYVLADHHALEAWGDSEAQKNIFSVRQPTIRPLYDTRSFAESLLVWGKAIKASQWKDIEDWHNYVQKYWEKQLFKKQSKISGFTAFWDQVLRDGVFVSSAQAASASSSARTPKVNIKSILPSQDSPKDLELALYSQVAIHDGAHANNPWLQELPDPVSKICWDNYASFAPVTAKRLGLNDGDIISLKVGGKNIEIPSHIQPGLHEGVVGVALGYGRTSAGAVGNGIGKNGFALSDFQNGRIQFAGLAASATKTGEKYILANPQQHQSLEGRDIVREVSYKEWLENPAAGNEEHEELTTVWTPHKYEGYRWAMAIDMNSCTGCNACVVSCQSENNIPVVGKDAVHRGRIMHWIRIDRYYTGTPDSPQVAFQPMLCQHCENAPCETVCPVLATVHDSEGMNSQIYNRCVGTRYCANNCPYKVRRFNWFEYNYGGQNKYPSTLAQNPEVTVRSRGVMEKCSFCVQRVHTARDQAKNAGRPIQDGEVKTACQQSCPADAIVFGNINDPKSEISKAVKNPRGYHVLEELNVRPSVTYLTRVRNTENL